MPALLSTCLSYVGVMQSNDSQIHSYLCNRSLTNVQGDLLVMLILTTYGNVWSLHATAQSHHLRFYVLSVKLPFTVNHLFDVSFIVDRLDNNGHHHRDSRWFNEAFCQFFLHVSLLWGFHQINFTINVVFT